MSGFRASVGVLAATIALGGCFTSGTDFADDAEEYIVDDERLRSALFPDSDTSFTEATCADPGSSDVGTTFTCTAVDSAGGAWEFAIEITSRNDYEVNVSRFPAGG